jgi:hypothetical protein
MTTVSDASLILARLLSTVTPATAAVPMAWAAVAGWGVLTSAWGGILLAQRRLRRDGAELHPLPRPTGDGRSPADAAECAISIIVPTRDAADSIARSLDSVLAQDAEDVEFVIVDDRSSDATPQVLAELEARDPRVRRVRVEELSPGWLGKSHALARGARTARGRWLLFVDDDCTLHPAAARTVVAEAERRGVELLTLWPRHDGATAGEHLVIPLCGGIIAMWYGRRAGEGLPFANGQFLLMSRRAYDRVGGHGSVRDALIEDVALANVAADAGIASFVGSGRRLVGVRMYDGLRSAMRGWSRIFVGTLRSPWRILLSMLWLVVGNAMPFILLPLLLPGLLAATDSPPADPAGWALAGQAGLHLVLMGVASWRFWGLGGCPRRWLALYPVSIALVLAILASAGWTLAIRRRVRWRNTEYRIDRRGRIQTA